MFKRIWQTSKLGLRTYSSGGSNKKVAGASEDWSKQFGGDPMQTLKGVVDLTDSSSRSAVGSEFLPRIDSGTYRPFDLGIASTRLAHKNARAVTKVDKFKVTGINPLALWKHPSALSQFITTNGKIIPGYMHGTKGKNQKRLSKAIRRCRAAGLLSHVHRGVDQLSQNQYR